MNIPSLFNLSALHSQLHLLLTTTRTKTPSISLCTAFFPPHSLALPLLHSRVFSFTCTLCSGHCCYSKLFSLTLLRYTVSTAYREGGFFNVSLICKKPNILKIKTKMFIFIASSNFFRVSCDNQSPEQVVK